MRCRTFRGIAAVIVACAALVAAGAAAAAAPLSPSTRFFTPLPDAGAVQQIAGLVVSGDVHDALLVGALAATPHAVWISGGTPAAAQQKAFQTTLAAKLLHEVPAIALYDIPGRDCSGYSAGGATDLASYEAWIDAVAAGIGRRPAVVILEPDSLGLLPQANCGSTTFTDADRYAELNYAVDTLEALGNTSVYLDGTHPAWVGVGDIVQRLLQAGVQRAQGFFLNVSNYETTSESTTYGTWIADCIAASQTNLGSQDWMYTHPGWCPGQYSPPTYQLDWSDANVAAVNATYAQVLGGATPTTHFVIDTSRNGLGPWTPPVGKYSGDPQVWCNPPGRGAGLRPTANTGDALLDAYLWVKVPGESDGSCNRSVPGATTDPEWGGIVDPAAGAWFPQQALQLAQLASPPLLP